MEFNSAFLMGPDGVLLSRYDKRILMPFGEYVPLASAIPFIRSISPIPGGFTPGQRVSVFDIGGRAKIGQLVCYEAALAPLVSGRGGDRHGAATQTRLVG